MSSAAEADIVATFLNAKDNLPIRTTLEELRHPQPPTPMQFDNTTSVGFSNNIIKQKRSKAIDMRFYWIRDRTCQGKLKIYWAPRSTNLRDYHTKHHPTIHHHMMRPQFLHNKPHFQLANLVIIHLLRGYVNSRKMCARAELDIIIRRHLKTVNPF